MHAHLRFRLHTTPSYDTSLMHPFLNSLLPTYLLAIVVPMYARPAVFAFLAVAVFCLVLSPLIPFTFGPTMVSPPWCTLSVPVHVASFCVCSRISMSFIHSPCTESTRACSIWISWQKRMTDDPRSSEAHSRVLPQLTVSFVIRSLSALL